MREQLALKNDSNELARSSKASFVYNWKLTPTHGILKVDCTFPQGSGSPIGVSLRLCTYWILRTDICQTQQEADSERFGWSCNEIN